MSDTLDSASPVQDPNQRAAEPSAKMFAKTRKATRFLFAVNAWQSQVGILKHRLSFPFFRQVLANEVERRIKPVPYDSISDHTLKVSISSHLFLSIVMSGGLLWALISVAQGAAALIKYDVYFNSWLISGIPLTVLTGIRLRSSLLAYKLMKQEQSRRAQPQGEQ